MGGSTRWTIMAELRRLGVKVLTGTRAMEIRPEGLMVEKEDKLKLILADTIVMATGVRSEDGLWERVNKLVQEVHIIGDARDPRNAMEDIREGFLTGLKI